MWVAKTITRVVHLDRGIQSTPARLKTIFSKERGPETAALESCSQRLAQRSIFFIMKKKEKEREADGTGHTDAFLKSG